MCGTGIVALGDGERLDANLKCNTKPVLRGSTTRSISVVVLRPTSVIQPVKCLFRSTLFHVDFDSYLQINVRLQGCKCWANSIAEPCFEAKRLCLHHRILRLSTNNFYKWKSNGNLRKYHIPSWPSRTNSSRSQFHSCPDLFTIHFFTFLHSSRGN